MERRQTWRARINGLDFGIHKRLLLRFVPGRDGLPGTDAEGAWQTIHAQPQPDARYLRRHFLLIYFSPDGGKSFALSQVVPPSSKRGRKKK